MVILGSILVRLGTIFDMKFMIVCHLLGNYGCYFGASKYNVRMTTAMNALGVFENLSTLYPFTQVPGYLGRYPSTPSTQSPGYHIQVPEYPSVQAPGHYTGIWVPR